MMKDLLAKLFFLATFIFFTSFFSLVSLSTKASTITINTPVPPVIGSETIIGKIPTDTVPAIVPAVNNTSLLTNVAEKPANKATPNNEITQTPALEKSSAIGKPVYLTIPSINVSARILHIGLTSEGAVSVPEGAFDTSWFSAGSRPGQLGSAVISGHTGIWKDGTHSIFDNLHTLQLGAVIYVKDDAGITRSFIIKETRVYGKNEIVPEIFDPSDKAYLNIITCHGQWLESEHTYSQRFVVFAQLQ